MKRLDPPRRHRLGGAPRARAGGPVSRTTSAWRAWPPAAPIPSCVAELCRKHRPRALALTDAAAVDAVARLLPRPASRDPRGRRGARRRSPARSTPTWCSPPSWAGRACCPPWRRSGRGKTVALANKEPLVMAGALMTAAARARKRRAPAGGFRAQRDLPVPGGPQPRRGAPDPAHRLGRALPDACQGASSRMSPWSRRSTIPTWRMGAKITVDSATLMNKGLEIIEARWLFDLEPEQVQVIVHPQSIVHSMVEYVDGSVIAQLGVADMGIPILYALHVSAAASPRPAERLDLTRVGRAHLRGAGRRALPVPGPGAPAPCWKAGSRRSSSMPPTRSRWRRSSPGRSASSRSPS